MSKVREVEPHEMLPAEDMVVYDLMDMTEKGQAFLLYPDDGMHGKVFFQQTGGAICHHHTQAAGLIRAVGDYRWHSGIPHVGCCASLSVEEADRLDSYFQQTDTPLKVERAHLNESEEAWVWVWAPPSHAFLRDREPAILTWENCD